jgi:ATP-binding cassette subfamily C protein CydC
MKHQSDLRTLAGLFGETAGRRLLLGACLSAGTVLAGMALLGLSGWFITATALAGLAGAAAVAFDVFTPSAGIRLLALGRTAGRYGERVVTHDGTLAVLAALRERLFRGWATPQAARDLLHRPARLLFRLTSDIDAMESVYLRVVVPLLGALAATLLASAVLAALDWHWALGLMAWLLACGAGIAWAVARRAGPAALRRGLLLERLRTQLIDLVAGQADLVMTGRLSAQADRVRRAEARLAEADDSLNRLETLAGGAYKMAGHLTVGAVLLLVGVLAERGTLSAPGAALLLLMALSALEPWSALRRGALEAARTRLAARRLVPRLREAAPESSAQPVSVPAGPRGDAGADVNPRPDHTSTPALCLEDVSARHPGREHLALQGVTLCIGRGERVAVIGPSGAGKSSLLAVAAGELPVQAGQVKACRSTWLTQRTQLFQDSVRDNLRLAAPGASDTQLWAALEASGLAHDIRPLPAGLDTVLGEGGVGLSGGQSRRLALARLLLHPADVWLLDEPTEGLDHATAADVLARLRRRANGRTVLIATHLRREAELADRLIVMTEGQMTADLRRGTPDFDAALDALRHHG